MVLIIYPNTLSILSYCSYFFGGKPVARYLYLRPPCVCNS